MSSNNLEIEPQTRPSNLFAQQAWVTQLRWVAGSIVVGGGIAEAAVLHWYGTGRFIAVLGVVILAYNMILATVSRRIAARPRQRMRDSLYVLVWSQIVADLVCLTLLIVWTGDYNSPLRGLFVCHMVFASLLLPRTRAFGVALAAIGMVEATLLMVAPTPNRIHILAGVGWDITLLATVYLASRLTRSLRRQRRRLLRQNASIRAMSQRLRRQQQFLIQQEKMIAMGQMAAGVAHEVANPLASMDGLLQLLERRPEKVTTENIGRLREQIARITEIVRQLTDFSHPGGEWRDANINDVVRKSLEVFRFDHRLKRLSVEKDLDASIPIMRLQPAGLEQVILNMAINAADAMDTVESPRLKIATKRVGDEVILTITDNGVGIPPDVCNRIFEPFFTTKPVGKGTGLGLSISYGLIRKYGGNIQVKSTPNEGTTFEIRFPITPDPSQGASQEKEGSEAAGANVGKSEME